MSVLDFLKSPQEIGKTIANNLKEIRLKENLSQQGLSSKSGVSLGSLKRFENSGEISLKSLILLSIALGKKQDLLDLFKEDNLYESIKDIKKESKIKSRKRGRDNAE